MSDISARLTMNYNQPDIPSGPLFRGKTNIAVILKTPTNDRLLPTADSRSLNVSGNLRPYTDISLKRNTDTITSWFIKWTCPQGPIAGRLII